MAYRLDNNKIQKDPNSAIGVKFPFNGKRVFNSTYTTTEQSSSNLKNLLLTGKGERYELTKFGTALKFLLFEQQTDELKIAIDEEIRTAVNTWLPYINIEELKVDFNTPNNNYININIIYTVSNIQAQESVTISSTATGTIAIE